MAEEQARREGQEGGRWVNRRPSGDEFAEWFKNNVDIDDALEAEDYLSGIVLIEQTEKTREVIDWDGDGQPIISEREHVLYVPYPKVETRIKYFHDLMAAKDDWFGVIEPIATPQQNPKLPVGFYPFNVATGEGREARHIGCTMKVTVYEGKTVKEESVLVDSRQGLYELRRTGDKIIDAPSANKVVPLTRSTRNGERIWADDAAMMKAETGAIGRAIGAAGMLVIPGSGVATAEDLQETMASSGGSDQPVESSEAPSAGGSTLPGEGGSIAELRAEAASVIAELRDDFPKTFDQFHDWTSQRGFGKLSEIEDERALRGLITKASRMLSVAKAEAVEQPTQEEEQAES